MSESINEELGRYIESKMNEREDYLKSKGKIIKGRKLSRNYMAKEVLGISGTWFSSVINGEKSPNDETLIRIAGFLEIDEHEIFKVARRVHPQVLEEVKREYLGDYYLPNEQKMHTN